MVMVDIDNKDHLQIIFHTENHGLNMYLFACFHFRITVADVLQVSFTAELMDLRLVHREYKTRQKPESTLTVKESYLSGYC